MIQRPQHAGRPDAILDARAAQAPAARARLLVGAPARACAMLGALVLSAGCGLGPVPRPHGTPGRPVTPSNGVEAVKQQVQVTPWELTFSGVRGARGEEPQFINLRNGSDTTLDLTSAAITGENASTFELGAEPRLPVTLPPKAHANLSIGFAPPAGGTLGLHRATLRVFVGPEDDLGVPVDLVGLVTAGPKNEPPLSLIVEALGFSVQVGAPGLILGTTATPLGDERIVKRFQRARPTPVAAYPVARYAADGANVSFGYWTDDKGATVLHELGVIAGDQSQTLNPNFAGEARTSFDPQDRPFGLYVKTARATLLSEDTRNASAPRHAARTYPLQTRAGQPVPDAYLVAFEDGSGSDYQDLVFLVYNARPAP